MTRNSEGKGWVDQHGGRANLTSADAGGRLVSFDDLAVRELKPAEEWNPGISGIRFITCRDACRLEDIATDNPYAQRRAITPVAQWTPVVVMFSAPCSFASLSVSWQVSSIIKPAYYNDSDFMSVDPVPVNYTSQRHGTIIEYVAKGGDLLWGITVGVASEMYIDNLYFE